MLYLAFGPLGLTNDDLWTVTLGGLTDMIEGWRYREFLRSRRDARLALWIRAAVWAKKCPDIEELTGVWASGKIMTKLDHYRKTVNRIKARKKRGQQ